MQRSLLVSQSYLIIMIHLICVAKKKTSTFNELRVLLAIAEARPNLMISRVV